MKSKQLGLFIVGVFALVLALSAVSADIVFSPTSASATITSGETSALVNFNLVHTGVGGNYTGLTWTSNSTQGTWTLPTSTTTLNTSQSIPLTATLTGISSTFTGTITGDITVSASGGTPTETLPVTITVNPAPIPSEITSCTTTGNGGNLKVKKISFTNNGLSELDSVDATFGKSGEWFPRENVDVEIQVKNEGDANNDKVNNIEVDWGLWDTKAKEWAIEPVDEKEFDLKQGKTNTMTVSFNLDKDLDVDLSDLSDGDNYKFYVTATGETDDGNDTATCAFDSKDASVVIESDFVVLDHLDMPTEVQCGQKVQVSADAWNVGDNDQDDVSVDVTGRENILGINDNVKIGSIDAFDSKPFTYQFTVPKNLEEGNYALTFSVKDDNNDVFQNDFSDDYSEFTVPFTVKDCGASASSDTLVAASLVSGGQAGKQLVVKATITNNGNDLKTYTVGAAGFSEWASSGTPDQNTVALSAGQSRDVTFTFDVDKSASGANSFYIELVSGTDVTRQPVSVNIEPSSFGLGFSGQSLPWVIGIVNLVLIIIIVFVAVKIAKK